jgi:hypothetical protein
VYAFTLNNTSQDTAPGVATVQIDVTSAANGDATAAISRTLLGVVNVIPATADLPAGGGTRSFTITGGSESLLSQDGGYSVSASVPGVLPNQPFLTDDGAFTITTDSSFDGVTFTVTVEDILIGQQAEVTITQAAP